jgi:hypothetical protein
MMLRNVGVTYKSTRRNNPEDQHRKHHRRENLRSYIDPQLATGWKAEFRLWSEAEIFLFSNA